jgi:hypothetical protein
MSSPTFPKKSLWRKSLKWLVTLLHRLRGSVRLNLDILHPPYTSFSVWICHESLWKRGDELENPNKPTSTIDGMEGMRSVGWGSWCCIFKFCIFFSTNHHPLHHLTILSWLIIYYSYHQDGHGCYWSWSSTSWLSLKIRKQVITHIVGWWIKGMQVMMMRKWQSDEDSISHIFRLCFLLHYPILTS